MQRELVERAAERRSLTAAIERLQRGHGGVTLIEGEAGIGKTSLLDDALSAAASRGVRTLRASAVPLEREFGYGVVRQLLEGPIGRLAPVARRRLFEGAAAPALPVFGLPAVSSATVLEGDPSFAVRHALFWVLNRMASPRPIVLAVDDAHWADGASLRWLAHLAARLEDLAALLVLTVRSGEQSSDEAALAELRAAALRLTPAPLTRQAVGELARHELGYSDAALRDICHARTAGNPLFVCEVLRAVREEGATALDRLPFGTVAERALRRLAEVSDTARSLAHAVAVFETARVHEAAALAALAIETAELAADELRRISVLAEDRPLRFAHPLLRDAVEAAMAPGQRSTAHRRAAVLLARDPARRDEAAAHLLHCEPAADPWAAELLLAAGERAAARGAQDAAVSLLRRALEEPPGEVRDRVALALAISEARLGRLSDAIEHLRDAIGRVSGAMRDLVLRELVATLLLDARAQEAIAVLEAELADLEGPEESIRETRLWLETSLGLVSLQHGIAIDRASERVLRSAASVPGETTAERTVQLVAAYYGYWTATAPAEATSLTIERILDADAAIGMPLTAQVLGVVGVAGRVDAARRLAERVDERGRRQGDARLRTGALWSVLRLEHETGNIERAIEVGNEMLALEWRAVRYGLPALIGVLIRALVDRGRTVEAEALLARHGSADASGIPGNAHVGRAYLHSALGRHDEAARDVAELVERLRVRRHAGLRLLDYAADVLVAAGQIDQAVDVARHGLARALRWGAPCTIAPYERVLGLALGDEGRLRRAVELLEGTPFRLELAKSLLALGSHLRRDRRRGEAREPLRRTLDLTWRMHAERIAAAAEIELKACGARPRRAVLTGVESLTPSELRVARLVADGLTNRRVAETLFISRSTVETHLRSIFRKLDVTSRAQIGPALPGLKDQGGATMRAGGDPREAAAVHPSRSTS